MFLKTSFSGNLLKVKQWHEKIQQQFTEDKFAENRGNSFWFMRTSGYTPSNITYVCDFGYLYNEGTAVTCDDAAVLPAITVDLAKASFQRSTPVASTDVYN